MGESARLEEENCDLQWSQSPHNAWRRVVRVSFLSARRKMEDKQVLFLGAYPYCLSRMCPGVSEQGDVRT